MTTSCVGFHDWSVRAGSQDPLKAVMEIAERT